MELTVELRLTLQALCPEASYCYVQRQNTCLNPNVENWSGALQVPGGEFLSELYATTPEAFMASMESKIATWRVGFNTAAVIEKAAPLLIPQGGGDDVVLGADGLPLQSLVGAVVPTEEGLAEKALASTPDPSDATADGPHDVEG